LTQEYLASLETLDNGKTYENALGDVDASVAYLRYSAGKICRGLFHHSPSTANSFLFPKDGLTRSMETPYLVTATSCLSQGKNLWGLLDR